MNGTWSSDAFSTAVGTNTSLRFFFSGAERNRAASSSTSAIETGQEKRRKIESGRGREKKKTE